VADPASRPSRRPSKAYSRMFSALAAGAFLLVTGSIGWNVSHMRGFFEGGRWVDGPIWSQIALGAGLLLLGAYWSRRLGGPGWTLTRTPRDRIIKNVGRGKTSGAGQKQERRRLASDQPTTEIAE
jgi:hypothetical protein